MNKKYFAVIIVGILFYNVAFAQNNTSTQQDLDNMIKQLQAQIQLLQTQVTDLKTEVQTLKIELKFSRVLTQGASGDDVKQLQEFLKTYTGAYPNGLITGYYGPLTAVAVKKFQAQNGIESAGVVGPKTQEKINMLASAIPAVTPCINCSPTTTEPVSIPGVQTVPVMPYQGAGISPTTGIPAIPATPCKTLTGVQIQPNVITVLSPNGGEQWQVGGAYAIKYSAKNVPGNKALLIYLDKGYDMPTTKTGANSRLLIGVTTNLESYTYVVPQNIQSFPGLGNNYKITIMVEGSYSSCGGVSYIGDSSDAEFSFVAGQYNVPPATSAGPTIPGGATTIMPISGGGYGQGQPSGLSNPANKTLTNTVGNGYLTTQEKIANIQAEINKLQNQLDTTTDTVARAHLPSQIVALKGQLQILPISAQIDTLHTKLEKATDDETKTSLRSQIDALKAQVAAILSQTQLKPIYVAAPPAVALTTQEKISGMQAQISAYQNKLDNTTDTSARDNLMTQIVTLKKIIQELQNSPTTPSTQPALSTPSIPVQISPAIQDKINSLFEQINVLQNQLNSTIDTATRDSLVAKIIELKTQINALQTNSTVVSETQSIIICHIPDGNTNNKQTITINKSALETHMVHGDAIGVCWGEPTIVPAPTPPVITIPQSCLLTVSLAASTLAAQYISPGQSAIPLVKFNATPNCNGTLNSFAVSLLPMPNGYQNISTLRLYNETSGAQLGTTQSVLGASVNFASLNTPLTANQTLVLKVAGDVSSSALSGSTVYGVFGGSYGVSASGGVIGNNASGNLIMGNTMMVATIPVAQHTITVMQGTNGTISPSTVSIANNSSLSFTITPATGYQIANVVIDNGNQGAISSFTFTNVQAPHTISASFTAIPSNLSAPTELKVGFGIMSGVANWVKISESFNFKFDLASLANVSAFRLYQKKPQDSSFAMVGEFSNPSGLTTCSTKRTYGTWTLASLGGGPTGCPGSGWYLTRTSTYPVSSYTVGDYFYYVTAVNTAGVEGPSSLLSYITFLGTFPIQTPIAVETAGTLNPTFRWQPAGGSSQLLSYWVIVAPSDGSGSQIMLTPFSSSGPNISKVYDGPALTPGKQYSVWIYGRSHNALQTEDQSSYASEIAIFTVTSTTTVSSVNNQMANTLGLLQGILNQLQSLIIFR